ncbi:MAG: hypothetical protein ACTSPU_00005 [Promethearchaeota archaeon]
MSSFIVSYEAMNNIINGLFWDHKFKVIHGHIFYKKLGLNKSEEIIDIAQKYLKMI